MNLTRLWWGLGTLLIAFVVLVCLVPGEELPGTPLNDKWNHLIAYFALAAWFSGLVPQRHWWKIFMWLLALGIGIEFAQGAMHLGREADVRDVAANAVGATLGLVGAMLGLARWPQWVARLTGRRTTS